MDYCQFVSDGAIKTAFERFDSKYKNKTPKVLLDRFPPGGLPPVESLVSTDLVRDVMNEFKQGLLLGYDFITHRDNVIASMVENVDHRFFFRSLVGFVFGPRTRKKQPKKTTSLWKDEMEEFFTERKQLRDEESFAQMAKEANEDICPID